jgi:hypothetical protein
VIEEGARSGPTQRIGTDPLLQLRAPLTMEAGREKPRDSSTPFRLLVTSPAVGVNILAPTLDNRPTYLMDKW